MQEINLYHLLKFYAKKWLVIVALTLIGLISGLVYSYFIQVPQYKSEATLILIDKNGTNTSQDTTLINNYIELFKSRRVLEPVISKVKLNQSYEELAKNVSASNNKGTEVIKLAITNKDPKVANNALNKAIDSFKTEAKELYNRDNIQVVDGASTADKPFNVNIPVQVALASSAGLILSFIIIFFIYDFKINKKETEADISIDYTPTKEELENALKEIVESDALILANLDPEKPDQDMVPLNEIFDVEQLKQESEISKIEEDIRILESKDDAIKEVSEPLPEAQPQVINRSIRRDLIVKKR